MPDKLKVLDLFSGVGGFSLGLERTGGFETVNFCEMKPHAQQVLAKNFPGVPCHDDVTTYEFKRGEADVITAGFPCQDISFAGEGAGLAGARSGLYREVIRAIRVVRPVYTILENVAALLSRGLDVVLGDMAEIGYDAEWHCIPASAVGAPHRRDRIWIVANPESKRGDRGGCRAKSSEGRQSSDGSRLPLSGYLERALADAKCLGQQGPRQPLIASNSTTNGQGEASDAVHGRLGHQWATQPGMGGMVNGFSQKLDGDLNAQKQYPDARAAGASCPNRMSGVQSDGVLGAAPSRLLGSGSLRGAVSGLSYHCRPARRAQAEEAAEAVQGLRPELHAVAQQEEQHMQPGVSFDAWPYECDEAMGAWAWEPNVLRVANGVTHRMDRLAALGNAVVPQIPELIGRAILQARAA